MHYHLGLNAGNILWILTFAAQLVLLVVLMGRDRIQRFPWVTASIAVIALRLLVAKLLFGRLPQITLAEIYIPMLDLSELVALGVLVEVARRSFAGASRRGWALGVLIVAAPAVATAALWGHWPAWSTLSAHSLMALLGLGQLAAQKLALFTDAATVVLGVLVVLLGARYGAGHRSHPQQIAIGLSTASLAQIAAQAIWQTIAQSAAPHTLAARQRVLAIGDRIFNANGAIYVLVIVWWIICMWYDEPGKGPAAGDAGEDEGSPGQGPTAVAGAAAE